MSDSTECCICFSPMKLPYTLDCNHTFCYLCIKQSLFSGNKGCPLCRKKISDNLVENAVSSLQVSSLQEINSSWLYISRSGDGWWYYDEETSDYIENKWIEYQKNRENDGIIEINILGMKCTVDFDLMIQKSVNNHKVHARKIIRKDKVNPDKIKGIAGVQKKQ